MKASLLLASLVVSLAAAASAQAQTPPPAPGAPTADAPMHGDFASHKTKMLARIDERMAEMTTMRQCVNAANTASDMKACHPMGHHGRKGGGAPT